MDRPRSPTHGHDHSFDGTGDDTHGASEPHVVVEHSPSGARVTTHPTKAAAMKHGKALRAKGINAFVHSKANAEKFGMIPQGAFHMNKRVRSFKPKGATAGGSHYSPKYGR